MSPSTQRRPTPIGFMLLGLGMAMLAAICGAMLLRGDQGLAARLLIALIASLSLVAAEALWWVRPWLGRAIDSWALACSSVLVAFAVRAFLEGYPARQYFMAMGVLAALTVAPCMVIRMYVRDRAAALGVLPGSAPPLTRRPHP